jgi:hypothetical protein
VQTRVPDAIPERVAAKRHTDPEAQAEGEEERWGMEQKRQRDLEQRQRAAQKAQGDARKPGSQGAADVTKQANQQQQKQQQQQQQQQQPE